MCTVHELDKIRVKMVRCIGEEPLPPIDLQELEAWCDEGKSGRPVQSHLGDEGWVLWVNEDGTLCVQFSDGDERVLYREEVCFVRSRTGD